MLEAVLTFLIFAVIGGIITWVTMIFPAFLAETGIFGPPAIILGTPTSAALAIATTPSLIQSELTELIPLPTAEYQKLYISYVFYVPPIAFILALSYLLAYYVPRTWARWRRMCARWDRYERDAEQVVQPWESASLGGMPMSSERQRYCQRWRRRWARWHGYNYGDEHAGLRSEDSMSTIEESENAERRLRAELRACGECCADAVADFYRPGEAAAERASLRLLGRKTKPYLVEAMRRKGATVH